MIELNDEHYLRAVTDLGDSRQIIADRDIYSESGMKLVSAGVNITSKLYERLVQHKLLSLDKSLSIDNMLAPEMILADVENLIGENTRLKKIADVIDMANFKRHFLAVQIPTPLAFKLTVMREKYLTIYQHSLSLLLISVYLAHCDEMNLREQTQVATAALFHDIGLLHIDPELLAPSHLMSSAERRHLYAHPLTAYLLISEFPQIQRDIAEAVLQHHERMDGSGYPRGLQGDRISRYGQIMAIAELTAQAFDSDRAPWEKLEMMLKLNSRQYGSGLIGHLIIFREEDAAPTDISDPAPLVAQIRLIAKLFEDFSLHADEPHQDKLFDLARIRLAALKIELFDAGFDYRNPEELLQLFNDDPGCMAGYAPLLNETLWQFRSLVSEIARQLPDGIDAMVDSSPEHAWLNEIRLSLARP